MSDERSALRAKLLRWFRLHGRHDLPWRGDHHFYKVLMSEFMLQQTTVPMAMPFYKKFMEMFPTVQSLAAAPIERVLAQWSGLGYYARAHNLHAAANAIVKHHGGKLPSTREAVLALPGVGPYIAGALLSYAYNQPEAAVDANVARILARLYGVADDIRLPKTTTKLWGLARALVPKTGGRDFNAALMDLGSRICKPRGPSCPLCPLRELCAAYKAGKQDELPVKGAKAARKRHAWQMAVAQKNGRLLLRRRPVDGLYGGLWEFPGAEGESRARESLFKAMGFEGAAAEPLGHFRHVLTHKEFAIDAWVVAPPAQFRPGPGLRWFPGDEVGKAAISSLTRRVWAAWKDR